MATDLAPEERRGEAVSYWSVALWGGLAFGPVLGELLLNGSNYDLVWYVAGGLGLTAAAVALFTRETHVGGHEERGRLIAPEAIRPGILLAATLIGITGFSIFLPLYAPERRGRRRRPAVPRLRRRGRARAHLRRQAARPTRTDPRRHDRHRARRTVGLAILAVWQTTIGLVVATVIVAVGSSFLYPSMLLLVLRGVPEHQRGSVVGTFSAFFDFAAGASGIVLGGLAAASSYAGAFAGVGRARGVALVLLRSGFARHESGELLTVTEVGTASVEPTSLP